MTVVDRVDAPGDRPVGWYADPVTVGSARWWDGAAWTDFVAWGGVVRVDPTPLADVERCARRNDAAVVRRWVDDAVRRGVIPDPIGVAIRDDLTSGTEWALPPPAVGRMPRPSRSAVRHPAIPGRPDPASVAVPPVADAPATVPTAASPVRWPSGRSAAVTTWWATARRNLRSDLTVHGLAYLGVLLVFAGVMGFIAFSFGDVAPAVRSLSELLAPSALFLAAWYLDRRGAGVVAAALTVVGGAVAPIVLVASVIDGAPVPPDLHGLALPLTQCALVVACAAAWLWAVRRHPSTPLRHLVGPTVWLAFAVGAAAMRDPIPAGYDVARPTSVQLVAILVAIVAVVLVCRPRGLPAAVAGPVSSSALPVAAGVWAVEALVASRHGWPIGVGVVGALSLLALLELLPSQLSDRWVTIAGAATIALTGLRTAAHGSAAWVAVGTAIALLALLEHSERRRPDRVAALTVGGAGGVAILATLAEAEPRVAALAVVSVWLLWRYVDRPTWWPIADPRGLAPGVSVWLVGAAVWDVLGRGPTLVGAAATVAVVAWLGRLRPRVAADPLWGWFVPAAVVTVLLASALPPWPAHHLATAASAALAVAALVPCRGPAPLRLWVGAVGSVWSALNVAVEIGVGRDAVAVVLAGVSVIVWSAANVRHLLMRAHLAAIGTVGSTAALAVPRWPGWSATSVVLLATCGWAITTLVHERSGAPHLVAISERIDIYGDGEIGSVVDHVPALMTLAGLWASGQLVLDRLGWIAIGTSAWYAVPGGVAMAAALAVPALRWRRVRPRVLEGAVLGVALTGALGSVGALVDRADWTPAVAMAWVVGVAALARPPRPALQVWCAWSAAMGTVVTVADRAGVDRARLDLVAAGCGAVVLLGALWARRRSTEDPAATRTDGPRLLAPLVVGAAAFAAGGSLALSEGSDLEVGGAAAGLAAVVLAAAVLTSLGSLVAPAELLATVAFAHLAPWDPMDRPWTFGVPVAAFLSVAWATRREGRWRWSRWDVPSFLVAHAVAAFALAVAGAAGAVTSTAVVLAVLALGPAAVLRRAEWAVGSGALLLLAGLDAGPTWFAVVLLAEGLASTVTAVLTAGNVRRLAAVFGTAALIGGWLQLVAARSWPTTTAYLATVSLLALAPLAAVAAVRWARLPVDLAIIWLGFGTVVDGVVAGLWISDVERLPGGLTAAAAAVVLASAWFLGERFVGRVGTWTSAACGALAWPPLVWALQPSGSTVALAGSAVGLLGALAGLLIRARVGGSRWSPAVTVYWLLTQAGAVVVAVAAADEIVIAVVLLAIAAELVVIGATFDRPEWYAIAPAAACASWLVAAHAMALGDPSWVAIPTGVTVLTVAGLVRSLQREQSPSTVPAWLVVIELVAMSGLVGPGVQRVVVGHLWQGLIVIAVGVALAWWGVASRVRWRLGFGVTAVTVGALLPIAVLMAGAITWRGPTLWIALVTAGIVAVALATVIERGRARWEAVARRVGDLTEGWERAPFTLRRHGGSGHDVGHGVPPLAGGA